VGLGARSDAQEFRLSPGVLPETRSEQILVKIPPEIIGSIITFLLGAQARGWVDLRGIEPLLKIIVESGNAPQTRRLLGEILQLLERAEQTA
jgi:hypothetical protein